MSEIKIKAIPVFNYDKTMDYLDVLVLNFKISHVAFRLAYYISEIMLTCEKTRSQIISDLGFSPDQFEEAVKSCKQHGLIEIIDPLNLIGEK